MIDDPRVDDALGTLRCRGFDIYQREDGVLVVDGRVREPSEVLELAADEERFARWEKRQEREVVEYE